MPGDAVGENVAPGAYAQKHQIAGAAVFFDEYLVISVGNRAVDKLGCQFLAEAIMEIDSGNAFEIIQVEDPQR